MICLSHQQQDCFYPFDKILQIHAIFARPAQHWLTVICSVFILPMQRILLQQVLISEVGLSGFAVFNCYVFRNFFHLAMSKVLRETLQR